MANKTLIGDGADNVLTVDEYGTHHIAAGAGNDIVRVSGDFGSVLDGGSGENFLTIDRSRRIKQNGASEVAAERFVFYFQPGISDTMDDGTVLSNFNYLSLLTGAGNDAFLIKPKLPFSAASGQIFSNQWSAGDGTDTTEIFLSDFFIPFTMAAPQ